MKNSNTTATQTSAATFEPGKAYAVTYIGNADLRTPVYVHRRTARSVWISEDADGSGEVKRKAVKLNHDGRSEFIDMGSYSMAPSAYAESEYLAAEEREAQERAEEEREAAERAEASKLEHPMNSQEAERALRCAVKTGRRIHYTGDMANIGGEGFVTQVIEDARWGPSFRIYLEGKGDPMEPRYFVEPRTFTLNAAAFVDGAGTRFKFADIVAAERGAALKRMRLVTAS